MRLERDSHFRAVGFLHGNEVLDGHGVQHLATKTFGRNAGTDALACRVNGGRRSGRATAHHQHVEGIARIHLRGVACAGTGVDLGQDVFDAHAAVGKGGAVQAHAGHGHDLTRVHFVLEQRAIDHGVRDAGIEHGHHVQRLHHVRAVVAGQRYVGFEMQAGRQRLDLRNHVSLELGRIAAGLQQGEHQRGEFMAERQAGKRDAVADAGGRAVHGERGPAGGRIAAFAHGDAVGELGNLAHQCQQLLRGRAAVGVGDEFDRVHQTFEIGLELGLEVGVEHGVLLLQSVF